MVGREPVYISPVGHGIVEGVRLIWSPENYIFPRVQLIGGTHVILILHKVPNDITVDKEQRTCTMSSRISNGVNLDQRVIH